MDVRVKRRRMLAIQVDGFWRENLRHRRVFDRRARSAKPSCARSAPPPVSRLAAVAHSPPRRRGPRSPRSPRAPPGRSWPAPPLGATRADVHRRARRLLVARPRARARARLAPAAALSPASAFAVGSLFDGAVGAAVAAVLGGVVARLAERLWRARHRSPLDVTHAPTPGNAALLASCPRFSEPYDAVDLLRNRHACTIAVSLFRQNLDIEYQREVLRMPDGGHVTLDWPIAVPGDVAANGGDDAVGVPREADGRGRKTNDDERCDDANVAETIRQLQYGVGASSRDAPPGASPSPSSVGSDGPGGVPGAIGVAGGGGSDGCGSGGGGCDPSLNPDATREGPHRRSIPDQGKTVLRARLAEHWRESSPTTRPC